jgi:hypothetical protein
MPATVGHVLSATTPDDPSFEIQPQHWNSNHAVTLNVLATEISGLFSNANGVSFGTTDGKITASVQTNYAGVGETVGTIAGTDLAMTVNTDGVSIGYPKWITTARASTDAVGLNTAQTNVVWTVNSAGISLNAGGYAGTGFTSTTTAGTEVEATLGTGGLSMAVPAYLTAAAGGGAGTGATTATTAGTQIKATLGTDGLSLAYPAALTTARASTDAVGLNTAQTNVTWTVNSAGISLNAGGYLTTAALSNHSHGNPTLALTNLSGTTASNSAGLTLSLAAAAPGGGAAATVSVVEIMDGARLTTCAVWNNATYLNRPIFVPFEIDNNLASVGTMRLMASRSSGTVLVATFRAGIYSRNNATSANLISSTSINYSVSTSAIFSGVRVYDITGLSDLSLPPGRYLFGLLGQVAASNSIPLHILGGDPMLNNGFVLSGTNQSAATASNSHIIPFWGVYSATSASLPTAVGQSEVSGGASQNSPDIYAILKAV